MRKLRMGEVVNQEIYRLQHFFSDRVNISVSTYVNISQRIMLLSTLVRRVSRQK